MDIPKTFNRRARSALARVIKAAEEVSQAEVDPLDLLTGLLEVQASEIEIFFQIAQQSSQEWLQRLRQELSQRPHQPSPEGQLHFAPMTKLVLEFSLRLAAERKLARAGLEDLFLACLSIQEIDLPQGLNRDLLRSTAWSLMQAGPETLERRELVQEVRQALSLALESIREAQQKLLRLERDLEQEEREL